MYLEKSVTLSNLKPITRVSLYLLNHTYTTLRGNQNSSVGLPLLISHNNAEWTNILLKIYCCPTPKMTRNKSPRRALMSYQSTSFVCRPLCPYAIGQSLAPYSVYDHVTSHRPHLFWPFDPSILLFSTWCCIIIGNKILNKIINDS